MKHLTLSNKKWPESFFPKKKLGQNFLFSDFYLEKIVKNIPVNSNTVIIEIGTGFGNLTNLLSKTNCYKIISFEKDEKLFQLLEKKEKSKKIIYIKKDVLKVDWLEICSNYKKEKKEIVIVGNLPYNIANSLIVKILFSYYLFDHIIFLVQKEVAERWVANINHYKKKYSAISVFINYVSKIFISFNISGNSFIPSSSVDGSLVVIKPNNKIKLEYKQLVSFFYFLKRYCFVYRRKTLWNNLKKIKNNELKKYLLEKKLFNLRPQQLSINVFLELFTFFCKNEENI